LFKTLIHKPITFEYNKIIKKVKFMLDFAVFLLYNQEDVAKRSVKLQKVLKKS
jgi:hypothetical protein